MSWGDVVRSAAAPATGGYGIGGTASVIWFCDAGTDKIYELSIVDFTEVRSAAFGPGNLYGIGGDATKIWHNEQVVGKVYELSTVDFSSVRSANTPGGSSTGTGGDANTIWHSDNVTDLIYELSTTDFSVDRSAASPAAIPTGIGGTATKIWHCDATAVDQVYELSTTDFSTVRAANSPSTVPLGMGGDCTVIWHSDINTNLIYELSSLDPIVVTPGTLALNLTFHTPTVLTPRVVTPGVLALNLTFYVPKVTLGTLVIPGTLALTLTPHIPTVLTPRLVTPGTLALAFTFYIPTVLTPRLVTPGTLALILTPHIPDVPITVYQVFIDGTHPEIRKFTRMVELRIEARSVADFTVVDEKGILSYQRGQPVTINDFVGRRFGGFIDTVDVVPMSPAGGLFHQIRCMDNHYLADKRLVALSFLDTVAGTIVSSIVTNYLDDEGVTEGTIEAGPDIVEAVFNYVRASDCLDALAEKAGKIWYINENKVLYFVDRTTTEAPWAATTGYMDKAHLLDSNPLYRNRQYIRGGRGTTSEQTEVFIGDGEQFAFTVGYPIEKVPTSVKVDAVGQSIGIKGIDEAKDCYWNKGDATITFTVAPPNADEVEVKYFGQFPILVLAEDIDGIAARLAVEGDGTGYVDEIADEPTLNDVDASIDAGEAKLARFGMEGKRFFYQTTRSGLAVGQIQPITYSSLGLNATEMLIESIIITRVNEKIFYDITAIQGPEIGGWSELFKALAGMKQEVIERLNVGSNQILIILVTRAENWEWEEEVDEFVAACHFPMATLYPRATIYPC